MGKVEQYVALFTSSQILVRLPPSSSLLKGEISAYSDEDEVDAKAICLGVAPPVEKPSIPLLQPLPLNSLPFHRRRRGALCGEKKRQGCHAVLNYEKIAVGQVLPLAGNLFCLRYLN